MFTQEELRLLDIGLQCRYLTLSQRIDQAATEEIKNFNLNEQRTVLELHNKVQGMFRE